MPFRVYYLDRRDRVAASTDIETSSLEEARGEAGAKNPGHPGLELWSIDEPWHRMQLVETTSPGTHTEIQT